MHPASTPARPLRWGSRGGRVVPPSTTPANKFNLTWYNNFTPNGVTTPAFPGALVADTSFNGAPEWPWGVTRWFEAGLYLPLCSVGTNNNGGLDGFKLRALFLAASPYVAGMTAPLTMPGGRGLNRTMDWAFVDRLRTFWRGKLIIKGIDTHEDARLCLDHGIDSILVSNHGGRSTETGRATIEALAVGARAPRRRSRTLSGRPSGDRGARGLAAAGQLPLERAPQ